MPLDFESIWLRGDVLKPERTFIRWHIRCWWWTSACGISRFSIKPLSDFAFVHIPPMMVLDVPVSEALHLFIVRHLHCISITVGSPTLITKLDLTLRWTRYGFGMRCYPLLMRSKYSLAVNLSASWMSFTFYPGMSLRSVCWTNLFIATNRIFTAVTVCSALAVVGLCSETW